MCPTLLSFTSDINQGHVNIKIAKSIVYNLDWPVEKQLQQINWFQSLYQGNFISYSFARPEQAQGPHYYLTVKTVFWNTIGKHPLATVFNHVQTPLSQKSKLSVHRHENVNMSFLSHVTEKK